MLLLVPELPLEVVEPVLQLKDLGLLVFSKSSTLSLGCSMDVEACNSAPQYKQMSIWHLGHQIQ